MTSTGNWMVSGPSKRNGQRTSPLEKGGPYLMMLEALAKTQEAFS